MNIHNPLDLRPIEQLMDLCHWKSRLTSQSLFSHLVSGVTAKNLAGSYLRKLQGLDENASS